MLTECRLLMMIPRGIVMTVIPTEFWYVKTGAQPHRIRFRECIREDGWAVGNSTNVRCWVWEFGGDKMQCNMVAAVIACTIGRPFSIFWHVTLLHCTNVACILPSSLGRPLCVISRGLLLRLCQT